MQGCIGLLFRFCEERHTLHQDFSWIGEVGGMSYIHFGFPWPCCGFGWAVGNGTALGRGKETSCLILCILRQPGKAKIQRRQRISLFVADFRLKQGNTSILSDTMLILNYTKSNANSTSVFGLT